MITRVAETIADLGDVVGVARFYLDTQHAAVDTGAVVVALMGNRYDIASEFADNTAHSR